MKYYKKDLKLIVKLSSYLANDRLNKVELIINEYNNKKYNPLKLYEVILQSYLFCGFPVAIESLRLFEKSYKNFKFPESSKIHNYKIIKSAGIANCNLIYKNNYKKLIDNMDKLSPDLKEWMIFEGYGKVLGRPGLVLPEREIVNVSILCSRYFENQLHSHLKGCLNTGVAMSELNIIIESFYGFINKRNVDKCKDLLKRINKEV